MKYNITHNSFISGEISEKLRARTDTEHYKQGVKLLENFTPATAGGAFKRTGPFVQKENILSSSANSGLTADNITEDYWLIPFHKKEDYLLAFRNDNANYLYRNTVSTDFGIYKEVASSETWSDISPTEMLTNESEEIASALQGKVSSGVASGISLVESTTNPYWYCQSNNALVMGSKDGSFPLHVITNEIKIQPLFSVWGRVFENTEYLIHPRSFFWTPYEDHGNDPNLELTFSSTGGGPAGHIDSGLATGPINTCDMTLSGGTITDYFKPGMFVLADGGSATDGVVFIKEIIAGVAKCIILVKLSSTTSIKWRRSIFYKDNYPTCGTFYQGRLVLAGVPSNPGALYFSATFQYNNFFNSRLAQDLTSDTSTLDYFGAFAENEPFVFEAYSTDGAAVQWLFPHEYLRVGTTKGDFEITYAAEAGALSSENIGLERRSGNPAGNVQPCYLDDSIIYVNRAKNQIRAIDSKNIGVAYKNTDLSILAANSERERVSSSPRNIISLQPANDKNVMFVMTSEVPEDGDDVVNKVFAVCMYKHANVAAFHSITFNSEFTLKDICSVSLNGADVLAMIGHINGELVVAYHYPIIDEKPSSDYNESAIGSYANYSTYLDFSKLRDAVNTSTITTANMGLTGCDYFNGKKVSIWYDGKLKHNVTWNGSYTLPAVADVVYIGYPYKAKLISNILNEGQRYGDATGHISRVDRATIHLYKSSGGNIGFEESNLVSLELDSTKETTTDKRIDFPQSPDTEPRVIIESEYGLPLNVLGMSLRGVAYEG